MLDFDTKDRVSAPKGIAVIHCKSEIIHLTSIVLRESILPGNQKQGAHLDLCSLTWSIDSALSHHCKRHHCISRGWLANYERSQSNAKMWYQGPQRQQNMVGMLCTRCKRSRGMDRSWQWSCVILWQLTRPDRWWCREDHASLCKICDQNGFSPRHNARQVRMHHNRKVSDTQQYAAEMGSKHSVMF